MDEKKIEITRDVVIESLKHCAKTGVRCVECPCGGAPACKQVYAKAVEIIESDATQASAMHYKIIGLEKELEVARIKHSNNLHQMWESMLQVQRVYCDRCRELEQTINRMKGR